MRKHHHHSQIVTSCHWEHCRQPSHPGTGHHQTAPGQTCSPGHSWYDHINRTGDIYDQAPDYEEYSLRLCKIIPCASVDTVSATVSTPPRSYAPQSLQPLALKMTGGNNSPVASKQPTFIHQQDDIAHQQHKHRETFDVVVLIQNGELEPVSAPFVETFI